MFVRKHDCISYYTFVKSMMATNLFLKNLAWQAKNTTRAQIDVIQSFKFIKRLISNSDINAAILGTILQFS